MGTSTLVELKYFSFLSFNEPQEHNSIPMDCLLRMVLLISFVQRWRAAKCLCELFLFAQFRKLFRYVLFVFNINWCRFQRFRLKRCDEVRFDVWCICLWKTGRRIVDVRWFGIIIGSYYFFINMIHYLVRLLSFVLVFNS